MQPYAQALAGGHVQPQVVQGLARVIEGFARSDQAKAVVLALDHVVVEPVGANVSQRGVPLVMKQAGFLVERVVGPANVQTAGRHLKISGELDLHAVRVDLGGSTGLDNFLNRLHASPDAGEAAQGKGVHAQVQNLLHTGRKEHRRATGLEDVVALVHGGGAFGHVVVAGHCYHATPGGGARHVGVLENIAAAVNTWAFAVPDAKHAIKLVGARRRKP